MSTPLPPATGPGRLALRILVRWAESGFAEAVDAVGVNVLLGVSFGFEIVQVGEGLADGEPELVRVELTPEEHGHELGGGARLRDGAHRFGEAFVVVLPQVVEAVMQASERQPVRRQHQRVGRQGAKALEGIEVEPERIAARLIGPDAHVRGDLRQDLVAGNQHVRLRTEEAGVLRRMAQHGEGVPPASADGDGVALAHRAELRHHRRHELPIVIAAPAEALDLLGADAVAAIVVEALRRVVAPHALPCELGHEPLRLRAPELHAETPSEPLRVAHVVGMEVGHEHAHDGLARELAGEELLPQLARRREPHARVDHGEPALVVEEPEVDVIQREGRRHADPADAGGDLQCAAALRRLRPRMDEARGLGGQRMLGFGLHAAASLKTAPSTGCAAAGSGRREGASSIAIGPSFCTGSISTSILMKEPGQVKRSAPRGCSVTWPCSTVLQRVRARSRDWQRMESPSTVTAEGGDGTAGGSAEGGPPSNGPGWANCTTMPRACFGWRKASRHSGSESSRLTIPYPAPSARAQTASRLGTLKVT